MFKVLVIDDEEIIREGLIKTLDWNSMNCEVAGEAEDGDEGLKAVESMKPDIVLTDIRMPGIDGLEMISAIRERKHDCKIIIITGFRQFEYAQEAVKLGAFRFLLKPVKTEELIAYIKEAINELKRKRSAEKQYNNMVKKVKSYYGLEASSSSPGQQSEAEPGNSSTYLVNMAVSYMKEHFSEDLDLKTIADELYVSTWHLSKTIKKETGSTFVNILNEIRVEEAKKLLNDPRYKVYEIAEAVGFSDVPYFTRLFKKVTGVTPIDFKNKFCGTWEDR